MRDPLIVLGMHRSGTRLLAQHLHRCGVFMGRFRNAHCEALFFLRRNQRLFRAAGATWDQPASVRSITDDTDRASAEQHRLIAEWRSARALRFFGPRNFIRRDRVQWGFKDRRTVFTAGLWLRVFPGSRFVLVNRNAVDVAASLRYRERNRRRGDPLSSPRCHELEGAFGLWCEYVEQAAKIVDGLPEERVYRLRYEDYLDDPAGNLGRMLSHFHLECPDSRLRQCAASVDPRRSRAFLRDDELLEFHDEVRTHPLMKKLGYDVRGTEPDVGRGTS